MLFLLYLLPLIVAHTVHKEKPVVAELSLPDLVAAQELPSNWIAAQDAKFHEGRVTLTPARQSRGSLWNRNVFSLPEFTIEFTFRSMNFLGRNNGGISMWLVKPDSQANEKRHNGPSKFDGLQLLVDSDGPTGSAIHAFLNDGSKEITSYDEAFGTCVIAYQDSTVPLTVKVVSGDHFRIEINNHICIQTNQVKIPKDDYVFGVTALNNDSEEVFEVLKVHVFDKAEKSSVVSQTVLEQRQNQQPAFDTTVLDDISRNLNKISKEMKQLGDQIITLQRQQAAILRQINEEKVVQPPQQPDLTEIFDKLRESQPPASHSAIDDVLFLLKIVLAPIFAVVAVIAFWMYRLRRDIKTKLL